MCAHANVDRRITREDSVRGESSGEEYEIQT